MGLHPRTPCSGPTSLMRQRSDHDTSGQLVPRCDSLRNEISGPPDPRTPPQIAKVRFAASPNLTISPGGPVIFLPTEPEGLPRVAFSFAASSHDFIHSEAVKCSMRTLDDAKNRGLKEEVRAGWREESAGWIKHHAIMSAWTAAATRLVVEGARAKPGDRVLDIASGTGRVAFAIVREVRPGGSVVSSDLVEEMVRGAERIGREMGVADVSYRQADAESLPFADASFDVATCLHGVMFFPEPERALREMHRVLAPAGRAALLAWGPPERNPFFEILGGPFIRRLSDAPSADDVGPFRFAASGSLARIMVTAGFERVQESLHEIPWDFPGTPDEMWPAAQEISSSLFSWFRASLTPDAYEAASREVQAGLRERYDGKKVAFTATMVLASGERASD